MTGDEGGGGWETGASMTATTVGATAVGATIPGVIATGDAAPPTSRVGVPWTLAGEVPGAAAARGGARGTFAYA